MNTQFAIQDQEVLIDPDFLPDVLTGENTGSPFTEIQGLWPSTPSQATKLPIQSVVTVTGSVLVFLDELIQESEVTQAQLQIQNAPILLLDFLARENDQQTFKLLVDGILWSRHQPKDLLHAIDLALDIGLSSLAIDLAYRGADLFPRHERIQQAARVLAPPIVYTEPGQDLRGVDESKAWLKEHAREYRGQWIAIRDGRLLGAATALNELNPIIGTREDASRTLVTKVL